MLDMTIRSTTSSFVFKVLLTWEASGLYPKLESTNFAQPNLPTHFQCRYIYGLPKVHKQGSPLRPIVSMVGILFCECEPFFSDLFAPYAKDVSNVLNSVHAVQGLECRPIEDASTGRLVNELIRP